MPQPILGVMVLYMNQKKQIEERHYFRKLITSGKKLGMHVFLFTPQDVDAANKRIYAHDYDAIALKWRRRWMAFPSIIFDRCRYQPTIRFKQLRQFRAKYPHLTYLNRPLANKWIMHQLLYKNSQLRPHLPDSRLYDRSQDVFDVLQQHSVVYLKPINGTGGRGIIRIERLPRQLYDVQGRNQHRRILPSQKLSKAMLAAKLSLWNMKQRYVIQQGIPLQLSSGRVHDYRLLIQKNGVGQWEITGCAGRIGAQRSVTSNLHGGGKAVAMSTLLKQYFSSEAKIESIKQSAYQFAYRVVRHIENQYETMCELALDIAIDRSGHIWLLEVNPKPSREIFSRIGEKDTYEKAITRPLEYAMWLNKQKSPD